MDIVITFCFLGLVVPCAVLSLDAEAIDRIRSIADRLYDSLVRCRRWFHSHPELSNREQKTAAEITRRLREIGYEPRTGIAQHGVAAVLEGGRPGPVVAWRADMDALPIEETVDVPWRSQNPGVMHACGHDVHTTVGLGVAELLFEMRDEVPGTIVFIFQPAEEGPPPGEHGGATLMIDEGALDEPRPEAIFGLHVMPTLETGTIGWGAGSFMASADRFTITVSGRMTHGSTPQDGVDSIWIASRIVAGLQGIVAREVDATRPAVVSVGSFNAGNRFNIIAGSAVLTGTVRALDDSVRDHIESAITRMVEGECAAHRATGSVEYERITPVLVNDPDLTTSAVEFLRATLGDEAVVETAPIMAAEDFADFAREVPGFYFFLGVRNEAEGWTSYVHTHTFQPDEESIRVGVRAAAALLLGGLSRK